MEAEAASDPAELSEDARLLEAATGYLEAAQQQLRENRRWVRIKRFERLFLRPFAIVRALVLIGVFSLLWGFLAGFGPGGAFSLGVLCTMVPILASVWKAEGGEDWSGFLADIHCADEVILALGEGHLLSWPVTHPEEGIEDGASWQQIWIWVEARKAQLTVELRQRVWLQARESVTNDKRIEQP